MRTLLLISSFFVCSLALAREGHHHPGMHHLEFADGSLHAHATWTTGPRVSDESVLRIEWKDGSSHQSIEPTGSFEVALWMPDMGHGSSPTQVQRVLDSKGNPLVGVYDVYNVFFIMAGRWEVNLSLTSPEGEVETRTIDVEIEGNGHGHPH